MANVSLSLRTELFILLKMDKRLILENLIKLRRDRGYTQKYMSQELGITQSMYSQLETGKEEITLTRLDKILEILNSDMVELISMSDEIVLKQELENIIKEQETTLTRLKKMFEEVNKKADS